MEQYERGGAIGQAHAKLQAQSGADARENRQIEGLVLGARQLNQLTSIAVTRLSEIRSRLLGNFPTATVAKESGPKAVVSELTDLRQNLEDLQKSLEALHDHISVLERV